MNKELLAEAIRRAKPWYIQHNAADGITRIKSNPSYEQFMPFNLLHGGEGNIFNFTFKFTPSFFKYMDINEKIKDITDKKLADLYFEPIYYRFLHTASGPSLIEVSFLDDVNDDIFKQKLINDIMKNENGISLIYRMGLRVFMELIKHSLAVNELKGERQAVKEVLEFLKKPNIYKNFRLMNEDDDKTTDQSDIIHVNFLISKDDDYDDEYELNEKLWLQYKYVVEQN